jgi:uncharacterized membrane protein (UPF0127 family)
MTSSRHGFLPLLSSLLLAGCSGSGEATRNEATAASVTPAPDNGVPLEVHENGKTHRFTVEVAATPQQQERGLMFRNELADDRGMIFPMQPPRTASFWMKDTFIPLDMLFIRTDGSVAFVAANVPPYSREPVSAGIPVAAVLELRGGRAAELGIGEGAKVQWGDCSTSAAPDTPPSPDRFCPG